MIKVGDLVKGTKDGMFPSASGYVRKSSGMTILVTADTHSGLEAGFITGHVDDFEVESSGHDVGPSPV